MSDKSTSGTEQCDSCGAKDWKHDGRFGGLRCGSCGWMPPKSRRDELKEGISNA